MFSIFAVGLCYSLVFNVNETLITEAAIRGVL